MLSENQRLLFWIALTVWDLYVVLKHEFSNKGGKRNGR